MNFLRIFASFKALSSDLSAMSYEPSAYHSSSLVKNQFLPLPVINTSIRLKINEKTVATKV